MQGAGVWPFARGLRPPSDSLACCTIPHPQSASSGRRRAGRRALLPAAPAARDVGRPPRAAADGHLRIHPQRLIVFLHSTWLLKSQLSRQRDHLLLRVLHVRSSLRGGGGGAGPGAHAACWVTLIRLLTWVPSPPPPLQRSKGVLVSRSGGWRRRPPVAPHSSHSSAARGPLGRLACRRCRSALGGLHAPCNALHCTSHSALVQTRVPWHHCEHPWGMPPATRHPRRAWYSQSTNDCFCASSGVGWSTTANYAGGTTGLTVYT